MDKTFLSLSLARFDQMRDMGIKTLSQLNDDDVHWTPDPESNSIAVLVQHLSGNMLSRFTDFLISDGEKPTRNRDGEFIERRLTRDELLKLWAAGWDCVNNAIRPLTEDDLNRIVLIRSEEHTVMEAIIRQLVHFSNHVGQIIYIAKHLRGAEWKTLSIPKGKSQEYVAVAPK